jgi:hypothetical protein
VGVALATVKAATAYLARVVTDAWAVVVAGGRLDWVQRGKLGLGGTHVAQPSMQAIEHLYTIVGATAVYAASEFDRCLPGRADSSAAHDDAVRARRNRGQAVRRPRYPPTSCQPCCPAGAR